MLHRVALVRTDVSEELSASIRMTRIGELGTTLAVTSNPHTLRACVRGLLVAASVVPSSPILVTLMKEALSSSETSDLTRATLPICVGWKTAVFYDNVHGGNNEGCCILGYPRIQQPTWKSVYILWTCSSRPLYRLRV
jgi:hypothetical protein